uniref:Uncharacterized protein n=1 Tax=Globisporangium ultimum (strain ATCC 200006 / CBS 805.95 / DAOM BR144) TaxID=431595 RepID=K3WP70_GLOUD
MPSAEAMRLVALAETAAAEREAEASEAREKAKADAEALAAMEAKVTQLEQNKGQLQTDLQAARATISDLEQKIVATEQSSDLFARQLASVKESYHTKLLLRDEEVALEKAAVTREKESELQHQQALFMQETELWKQQIGSLMKSNMGLQAQNTKLAVACQELQDANEQLESKCQTLQTEQSRDRDEIQYLSDWKEQYEHTLGNFDAKQAELEQEVHEWMSRCEQLKHQVSGLTQQVNGLLLEREDQHSNIDQMRHQFCQEERNSRARFQHNLREVHRLRGVLHQLVSETRESLKAEMKATESTLLAVQEHAYEFAIRQNQKDMRIVSAQNKIIQLEAQRKNDKQTMNQLEAALAKATKTLERKNATFTTKYHEQKEHLDITLAVRHGLTNELHMKKQQVLDLEKQLANMTLAKDAGDVKRKQLQQQIKIMQHTHARELENCASLLAKDRSAPTARNTTTKKLGSKISMAATTAMMSKRMTSLNQYSSSVESTEGSREDKDACKMAPLAAVESAE